MTISENLKPCNFEKWAAVTKWKLSEAACILSGYEPSASALACYEASLISMVLAKYGEDMYFDFEGNDDMSAHKETWIEYAKQGRVLSESIEKIFADAKELKKIQVQKSRKLQNFGDDDWEEDDWCEELDVPDVTRKPIKLVAWSKPADKSPSPGLETSGSTVSRVNATNTTESPSDNANDKPAPTESNSDLGNVEVGLPLVSSVNTTPKPNVTTHTMVRRKRNLTTIIDKAVKEAGGCDAGCVDAWKILCEYALKAIPNEGVLVGYSSDGVQYRGKTYEDTGAPDVLTYSQFKSRFARLKKSLRVD